MEYRRLGDTDLTPSAIGFGTFELNREYGAIDDAQVIDAINYALDLGVTCIDTAPIYGFGHAEEVVGKAIANRREDVVLVTKCGIRWADGGKRVWDGSHTSIMQEIEESLVRLGTEYIDLYLVHYSPAQLGTPMEETLRALQDIRSSGKARYVGVSNYTLDEMTESVEYGPVSANQIVYNLFDRRNEPNLAFCQSNSIGVMTHGSLSSGLLTGAFTAETRFDETDWRRHGNVRGLPLMVGANLAANVKVVERLKSVAQSLGKTQPQLAVNWVLSNPAVTVALTGCRNRAEIEENVGAAGWQIPDEAKQKIEEIMQGAAGTSA